MSRISLFITALFFYSGISAQIQFQTTLHHSSNDTGVGIDLTEDNGYIVAGTIFPGNNGGTDITLTKLSESGDVEWSKIVGGSGDDNIYEIHSLEDGYILIGTTYGFDSPFGAIQVIRFDITGDVVWSKIYNSTSSVSSYGMQVLSNGDYLVTGYVDFGDGDLEHVLIRINDSGDEIWHKVFGTLADDLGGGILELDDNSLVFTSSTQVTGDGDISLHRLESDGDLIWSRSIAGNVSGSAYTIDLLDNGNIMLQGETHETIGNDDVWILEVDLNGQVIWSKVYGIENKELRSLSGEVTEDGNIIACFYDFTAADSQMGLLKTDAEGNMLWFHTYTSSFFSQSRTVKETPDGGFVIVGMVLNGSQSDLIVIKTDDLGNTCGAFANATITAEDWATGAIAYTPELLTPISSADVNPTSSEDLSLVQDMICTTVNINEEINTEINIYPNPALSSQDIIITGTAGSYMIADQTGKICVNDMVANNNNSISIHSLSPGIYTLVFSNGKQMKTEKLVVLK